MSELEADILDVGSDYSTCASDVNFFEPLLVHKTAILGIGFTASEKSDCSSELGNKEMVAMMSDACETFCIDSDPIAKVFVESWIVFLVYPKAISYVYMDKCASSGKCCDHLN